MLGMDVLFSSEDMKWSTPQDFYDILNEEFNFTLDPACSQGSAKCETYFTPVDDGLKQSWEGHTIFLNPPYGREIGDWMLKAAKESELHGVTVVCLVPSRTDTVWWHSSVFEYNADVRFVKGRLKFGNAVNSAPFPSAVVIFSPESIGRMSSQERPIKTDKE
jgi:phage N-6-adenine-methyltransferase